MREGISVVDRTLEDNKNQFMIVLLILFDITIVMEKWDNFFLRDVDGFYTVLERIDKNARFKGLEDKTNKLLSIETYYRNCLSRPMNKNPVFSRVLEVVGSGKKR